MAKRSRFTRRRANEPQGTPTPQIEGEGMRLNKFIAHSGVCSRRQAADLVKAGEVTVNGEVEKHPAYLVQPTDLVTVKGEAIELEKRKVYVLMNKPKDHTTTLSDERGRKTVMNLLGRNVPERIYPVGRLDRATTGLLLLTNDGDLAQRLSHPSYEMQKMYQVTTDKPVTEAHLEAIRNTLVLEDGPAPVDSVDFVKDVKDRTVVGIGLHIGRNRIVRRIFEHLGYEVLKLDRTYYAGLTKKDLSRGRYRFLTEREIIMLKHFK